MSRYIFITFVLLLSSYTCRTYASDIPTRESLISIKSVDLLKANYFPAYARLGFSLLQTKGRAACSKELSKVKLSLYSAEPEKFILLKALCLDLPSGEQKNISVQNFIQEALNKRASSSDVLFISAILLAENNLFDLASQKITDALWFKSFKQIPLSSLYFVKAKIEFNLSLLSLANNSLSEAKKHGFNSTDFDLLELEAKINTGDRNQAIKLARNLQLHSKIIKQAYLVRALILGVNPSFHKKDIEEAALISKSIATQSNQNVEVALACAKASLLFMDYGTARLILDSANKIFRSDARIQSLLQQLENEEQIRKKD